jgi:antitoxin component YwqK of YwqJK toxin-antitoxin module
MRKIIILILLPLITLNIINAQDTIVDLSIDSFISIEYNALKRSESNEFAVVDSINYIYSFKFSDKFGSCTFSVFSPKGYHILSGKFVGDESIEYYTFWSPNIYTGILEKESYFRIRPKRVGKWKYYDKDGKLIKTEKYKADKLVK